MQKTYKKLAALGGMDKMIINHIVDGLHVSASIKDVGIHVAQRLENGASKSGRPNRRAVRRAVFLYAVKRHLGNVKLYRKVMGGNL